MKNWLKLTSVSLVSVALQATSALAQEVVVGVPVAATGIFSFAGVSAKNGIEIARAELEKSGELGTLKIKLLVEDTASDKNQATTLVNKFVKTDKVSLILGPTSTPESLAALPIAQENKVPVLSIASGDVYKIGDWVFKATTTPAKIMEALAEYALKNLNAKRVAYVFNRDNDSYLAQKNGIRDVLASRGVTTVAEETIVGSDTDFSALATKLTNLDIDTLVITTTAEVTANIVIQSKQAGLSPKVRILGAPSVASAQFIKVGGAAVEGSVFVSDYFPENSSELNKRFVAAYQQKFGLVPDIFSAMGYTQFKLAATAIKNAGPSHDRAAIRQAISQVKDLPTVLGNGTLTQTANRTPIYGGYILTVKNGKFVSL
ncbi:MAG: ABC transporter substrate-binding protein [Rhodoferax sp.]